MSLEPDPVFARGRRPSLLGASARRRTAWAQRQALLAGGGCLLRRRRLRGASSGPGVSWCGERVNPHRAAVAGGRRTCVDSGSSSRSDRNSNLESQQFVTGSKNIKQAMGVQCGDEMPETACPGRRLLANRSAGPMTL